MRYSLLIPFALLVFSCILNSCNSHKIISEPDTNSPVFPDDWLGHYKGTLELYHSEKGKHMEMPMTVILTKTDTANRWHWYSKVNFNGKDIVKDYHLFRTDSMPKNHFLMDENNGIYLDRVLLGNAFYDYFEVNGTGLYGITQKVGANIHFEIASFSLASKTYSTYQGSEFEVDTVTSFKVKNTQKVILRPVKK